MGILSRLMHFVKYSIDLPLFKPSPDILDRLNGFCEVEHETRPLVRAQSTRSIERQAILGHLTCCGGIDIVVVENLGVPVIGERWSEDFWVGTHIMIFHVSTGRSASLKDQSNFSSATGSSVGSWYGARYG